MYRVSKKIRTVVVVLNILGWSVYLATQSEWFVSSVKTSTVLIPSLKTDEADLEWVQQRQKLLSDPSRPTKVLLMTYMRGGSTFLGQLFNTNHDAMYWYEVGNQFYTGYFAFPLYAFPLEIARYQNGTMQREILAEEKRALSDYFQALYSCELEKVPLITVAHPFIKESRSTNLKCSSKYIAPVLKCGRSLVPFCRDRNNECFHNLTKARQCISDGTVTEDCSVEKNIHLKPFAEYYKCIGKLKQDMASCLVDFKSTCQKAKIHSSKVHRLAMESVEPLLKDMPDIHIVYYTRDPRGILDSRSHTGQKPNYMLYPPVKGNIAKAAQYVCPRMMRDLETVKRYKTKYPGAFMNLAYEDLAANPGKCLQKVYSFIGKQVPENVNVSLFKATHAKKANGARGTHRKNATETSLKWRERMNATILAAVDSACSDIYRELGLE